MNAFGETVIQTIYNKENNKSNQPVNDVNNNLNSYDPRENYIKTASKEGAIDLENIQILNSSELNQDFNIINQQKYFTNLPPENINLNNNMPSSNLTENNPYNQYSQNKDLIDVEIQSYRIIQNGESIPNNEQNVLGTQDTGIINFNNYNLDNNISQYNLGNSLQNGNEHINNNNGDDQIMNNQIYYSNDIYNKSNQQVISNNNF